MIRVNIIEDERVIFSVAEIKRDGLRLAWAQEGVTPRGWCAFTEKGEIICSDAENEYFELVVRAALNSLDLNGADRAFCTNKALESRLAALGFEKYADGVRVNLKKFFKPCGGCAKK